jgi:cardiolipin synthase A/B
VLDASFAEAQRAIFDAGLRLSRRVTLAESKGRSWRDKLPDARAGMQSSQW